MTSKQYLILCLLIVFAYSQVLLQREKEYQGNVYKKFEGKRLVQECQNQCITEKNCISWSVEKINSDTDLCSLKDTAGNLVDSAKKYSGVKSQPIKYYMGNYELDTDLYPTNGRNLDTNGNNNNDPDVCQQRCLKDSRCVFWLAYSNTCYQRDGGIDRRVLRTCLGGEINSNLRSNYQQIEKQGQDAFLKQEQERIAKEQQEKEAQLQLEKEFKKKVEEEKALQAKQQKERDGQSTSKYCTTLYSECDYKGQTERFCERDIPISYINGPDFVTKSIQVHNEKGNVSVVKVVDGNNYYIVTGSQPCIKGITAAGFKLVTTKQNNLVRQTN